MPKARNIGTFRDRITFQSQDSTPDGIGGFNVSGYSDVFSTWADVQEMRGNREMRFGQLNYNTAFEIKCRYRNGGTNEPSTDYRIVWNGKNLIIHAIIEKHESYIKLIAYTTGL
ncbi:MAG: phage head closure protein [Croceimicrobium sp.]